MLFLAAVFLVGVLSGATAAISGFGIGSLLTPLVALEVGTGMAIAAVTIPHAIATALRGWRLRRSIAWPVLRRFGFIGAAGSLAGALLQARLGGPALTSVLGGLLILTGIAGMTGWTSRVTVSGPAVPLLGLLSGLFGGLAGNQGGLRAAALSAFKLPPVAFVATATAIGLLVDAARAPVYLWQTGPALLSLAVPILVATVGVVLGTMAGERILLGLPPERFRLIVSALIGLLGLGLLTGILTVSPDREDPRRDMTAFAPLKPSQLTAATGYDGFLAFAPDGKSIAFSSNRTGALEVYVQGIVPGSAATALTSNGRHNIGPAWSPDAQFIAYHEMAANGIWIVSARGGAARRVSDFGSHPAWSPDGRHLAFQSSPTTELNGLEIPGAPSTIWIVDALGRNPPTAVTILGEPAGPHVAPAWLPDSRRLLFAVPADTGRGRGPALWSVDIETRRFLEVSASELITAEYTLAPGGRSLYFQGRNAIWWLPLNGNGTAAGEPRPTGIPAIGSVVAQLAISSDGRRMAWTALNTNNHVWASYRRDGNTIAAPLTEGEGAWYGLPQPASDGRLALAGNPIGSYPSIFLLAPGSPLRQLTMELPNHGGPHWMPGEREIAFVADHGQGPGFHAVDSETGSERPLFLLSDLPTPPGQSQGSTSSPSTHIAFAPDFSRLVMAIVQNGVPNLSMLRSGMRVRWPACPAHVRARRRHLSRMVA